MGLAALKDLCIFAWDINSAYLHGKINHDIYISFPEGYRKPSKVGKLNKALWLTRGGTSMAQVFREETQNLGLCPSRQ